MDRDTELAHLALAEKAVTEGERHILHQERLIADLDRHGHDTTRALATLAVLRRMQFEHVAHCNFLLKLLRDGPKPELPSGPIYRPGHYDGRS